MFMFKTAIKNLIYSFLRVFGGKEFGDKKFPYQVLMKSFFWQKILRVNSGVKWPVHHSSRIINPENIIRGNRCPGLSMNVYLDARNGIELGKNVWIGPKVSIVSMNHDVNKFTEYMKTNPITIGDDCWIGAHAVILPGVQLGNHIVVGAGSVVTKSFREDDILIAGNPARFIKNLDKYENS